MGHSCLWFCWSFCWNYRVQCTKKFFVLQIKAVVIPFSVYASFQPISIQPMHCIIGQKQWADVTCTTDCIPLCLAGPGPEPAFNLKMSASVHFL